MLNAAELSALTQPLITRAALTNRTFGFRDQAARFVLERLGVMPLPRTESLPEKCYGDTLESTQWIDDKIKAFFETYPKGQGIEVDAGLSTRFHRLCESADWPRFSWQLVSPPEVADCLNYVFPPLDNFRSVASETPAQSWGKYAFWQGALATIAVIGDDRPLHSVDELAILLEVLEHLHERGGTRIEVVVRHRLSNLRYELAALAPEVTLLDELRLQRRQSGWSRWLQAGATGNAAVAHLGIG